MKRSILPARRLRLRASTYVTSALFVLLLLAFAAGGVLGTIWFVSSGGTILRDQDVWERGVVAQEGSIRAKRTSKLIPWLIANYDGTVDYADAEGARYQGSIEFWTMFGGPDTDNQAELRYDPQHHERFAISWGIEASGARWRAVVMMTALLVLLTLVFAYGAWVIAQNARGDARVAAEGDEVQPAVVSATPVVKEGKPTGKYQYVLELDAAVPPARVTRESTWLLTCAPNDSRVLGLWQPGKPASLILIRSDLAPLAVTAAERAEINARAEQARSRTA
jgi:flagellar basal body-associated protein FliL